MTCSDNDNSKLLSSPQEVSSLRSRKTTGSAKQSKSTLLRIIQAEQDVTLLASRAILQYASSHVLRYFNVRERETERDRERERERERESEHEREHQKV